MTIKNTLEKIALIGSGLILGASSMLMDAHAEEVKQPQKVEAEQSLLRPSEIDFYIVDRSEELDDGMWRIREKTRKIDDPQKRYDAAMDQVEVIRRAKVAQYKLIVPHMDVEKLMEPSLRDFKNYLRFESGLNPDERSRRELVEDLTEELFETKDTPEGLAAINAFAKEIGFYFPEQIKYFVETPDENPRLATKKLAGRHSRWLKASFELIDIRNSLEQMYRHSGSKREINNILNDGMQVYEDILEFQEHPEKPPSSPAEEIESEYRWHARRNPDRVRELAINLGYGDTIEDYLSGKNRSVIPDKYEIFFLNPEKITESEDVGTAEDIKLALNSYEGMSIPEKIGKVKADVGGLRTTLLVKYKDDIDRTKIVNDEADTYSSCLDRLLSDHLWEISPAANLKKETVKEELNLRNRYLTFRPGKVIRGKVKEYLDAKNIELKADADKKGTEFDTSLMRMYRKFARQIGEAEIQTYK